MARIAVVLGCAAILAFSLAVTSPPFDKLLTFAAASLVLILFWVVEYLAVRGVTDLIRERRPELLEHYGLHKPQFSWVARHRKLLQALVDHRTTTDTDLAKTAGPMRALIWVSYAAIAAWAVTLFLVGF